MKETLLLLLLLSALCATDTLVVSFASRPDSKLFHLAEEYITEVNKRTGDKVIFKVIHQPLGRSVVSLCEDKIDGDLFRIASVYDHCHNVIKVPVIVYTDSQYGYFRNEKRDSFPSHPDTSLDYVAVLGSRTVLHWREFHHIPFQEVSEYRQGFKMVHLGRSDCFVGSRVYSRDSLFKKLDLVLSPEPIIAEPTYLFIHKKHEKHMGLITKVLYEMKEENVLQSIVEGTFTTNK